MGKKDQIIITRADYEKWTSNIEQLREERQALRSQNQELRDIIAKQEKDLAFLGEIKERETLTDVELQTLLALARPTDLKFDEDAFRGVRHFDRMYGLPPTAPMVYRPVRTPLLEKAERALEVELTRRGIFPAPPGAKVPAPVEPVKELTVEIVEREVSVEPPPEPRKEMSAHVKES